MLIDQVNLNHLRVFESVYRTRSMTLAAKELHLTQSGVSQHVKSLEDVLGVKLFDRIKQKLVPTNSANTLFKRCSTALYSLEETLGELKGGQKVLSGTVTIGTPVEFGNNIIVPGAAMFCREHPRVNFHLRYGFATVMSERILDGTLDFAFVDGFGLDKRITTEKVYDEILYLCATPEFLKRYKLTRENRECFESLEYVDYLPGAPVLKMWFEHHFGSRKFEPTVRAMMMDVQGVARMILTGTGAGVLPDHLITKLEQEGKKLHRFKGNGRPLKNTISIAYLKDKTHSPAAGAVLQWIQKALRAGEKNLTSGAMMH